MAVKRNLTDEKGKKVKISQAEINAVKKMGMKAALAAAGPGRCLRFNGALRAPAAGLFASGHARRTTRRLCLWHGPDRSTAGVSPARLRPDAGPGQ